MTFMRVTGVHLSNIACFVDLSLDFVREETNEPASWVVLIGETPDEQSFDRVAENVLASLRQRHQELEADRHHAPLSEETSKTGSAD